MAAASVDTRNLPSGPGGRNGALRLPTTLRRGKDVPPTNDGSSPPSAPDAAPPPCFNEALASAREQQAKPLADRSRGRTHRPSGDKQNPEAEAANPQPENNSTTVPPPSNDAPSPAVLSTETDDSSADTAAPAADAGKLIADPTAGQTMPEAAGTPALVAAVLPVVTACAAAEPVPTTTPPAPAPVLPAAVNGAAESPAPNFRAPTAPGDKGQKIQLRRETEQVRKEPLIATDDAPAPSPQVQDRTASVQSPPPEVTPVPDAPQLREKTATPGPSEKPPLPRPMMEKQAQPERHSPGVTVAEPAKIPQSPLPDADAAEVAIPTVTPTKPLEIKADAKPDGMSDLIAGTGTGNTGPTSAAVAPAAQEPPSPAAMDPYDQIVLGLKGKLDARTGKAEITLEPPNLGTLKVSVALENGVLTAEFQSASDVVRELLSTHLDKLKTVLQGQGVAVDRLAVGAPAPAADAGGQGQQASFGSAAHDGRSAGGFAQEQRPGQQRPESDRFSRVFQKTRERPIDLVA